MGLSSSQGRLLTITARLTSNEYESQQISNAKMRLAVQSQEASEEYIGELNKQVFNVVSYDSSGNMTSTPLTAGSLYEYNDTKNQYILTNSSGKPILNHKDAENYRNSRNLEDFLSKYGLKKIFKTQALAIIIKEMTIKLNMMILQKAIETVKTGKKYGFPKKMLRKYIIWMPYQIIK